MKNELLDAALRYADNGYKVFPLHGVLPGGLCTCRTACRQPGKHPRTSRGFHDATDDFAQITKWWESMPDSNVGIATGEASGLWVLDVDSKRSVDLGGGVLISEGDHSLRQLEAEFGPIPGTLTSETGSGKHLYFAVVEGAERLTNRTGVLPSIDVRANGGYVVAPPSKHASGATYRWADPDQRVVEAPVWLVRWVEAADREKIELTDDLQVAEGNRNDFLFRIGARLRGQHCLEPLDLYGALLARNAQHCKPPLDRSEVALIAESASRYPCEKTATLADDPVVEPPPPVPEGSVYAISIGELSLKTYPDEPELIAGMLEQQARAIIAGMGNIGKSWLVYDMCLALATGDDWLGKPVTEQVPVLLIDEEDRERWVRERLLMLAEGRELGSLMDIPLYVSAEKGIKLDDPTGNTIFRRLLDQYRPKLVVFDSLVRMHRGDENSNKEMATFFENMQRLQQAYGCSFLFTHHLRKPTMTDTAVGHSMRGASDIRNTNDTVFIATPGQEKNEVILHFDKFRHRTKPDPVTVQIAISEDGSSAQLRNLGHKGNESESITTQNKIVTAIHELGANADADHIAEAVGKSTRTVRDYLGQLERIGRITSQTLKSGGGRGRPLTIYAVADAA